MWGWFCWVIWGVRCALVILENFIFSGGNALTAWSHLLLSRSCVSRPSSLVWHRLATIEIEAGRSTWWTSSRLGLERILFVLLKWWCWRRWTTTSCVISELILRGSLCTYIRKAHIINPQLKMFSMFSMLRDRQLMPIMTKVAREVAFELLFVCN